MKLGLYWKELTSILSLILIVVTEVAYRQPAYDYGLEFIAEWQDEATKTKTNFFKFISLFGSQEIQAAVFILVYTLGSRKLVIKFLALLFFAQVSNTYLKMIYHNPRPYYSSDDIAAMTCSPGYGNPSGHCLLTIGVYGTLWIYLFTSKYDSNSSTFPKYWQREVAKWFSLLLIIVTIGCTFVARMHLGAHSLNQTIYGSLLGIWVVFTFGIVLAPCIDSHFENFVKQGSIYRCNAGFVVSITTVVILQVANIVLFYSLKDHKGLMNDDWLVRIKKKCPDSSVVPLENSFKGTLHGTLYAFLYFSQLFSARKFPKAFNYWRSRIGTGRLLVRTLIMGILLVISYIPYFITLRASFAIKMWVGIFFVNILTGFIVAPLLDWITEKFKLISTAPPKEKHTTKGDSNSGKEIDKESI